MQNLKPIHKRRYEDTHTDTHACTQACMHTCTHTQIPLKQNENILDASKSKTYQNIECSCKICSEDKWNVLGSDSGIFQSPK